ncbi:MAG: hypothetical protein AAB676_07355, partial [Verrucomicrobiota bacterium]
DARNYDRSRSSMSGVLDSDIVDLILRAENAANGGQQNSGGGVTVITQPIGDSPDAFGQLMVPIGPPEAVAAGAGWRLDGFTDYITNPSESISLYEKVYTVQFAPVADFVAPTNFDMAITNHVLTTVASGMIYLKPQQPQAIDFPEVGSKMLGAKPFRIAATASSGLPVVFEIVSGPATIIGDAITLTGVGAVTVRAVQGGNEHIAAAAMVIRSFTVIQAPHPALKFSSQEGLLLEGSAGLTYRVEFAETLGAIIPWRELTTLTATNSAQVIPDTKPGHLGQGYYRAVLVIE